MKSHDLESCVEDLRKLYGLPPYDGPDNYVQGDGIFARSIKIKYFNDTYNEATRILIKETSDWERFRNDFTNGRSS